LKIFKYSFIVSTSIDKAWEFYTDIQHLKIITPPNMNLKIVETTKQTIVEGQEAIIEGKIIFLQRKWRSKITYLKPYTYVDEMLEGPLKWKHTHLFKKINEFETNVIDEIEFEIPLGIFGKLFEGFVLSKLTKIFEYREISTKKQLENN
jgi:ligand-binding SRPBCC domain-containing protein